MKPTVPTVCSRYEIRAPVFHLPYIRHTFAEHSVLFCLINLLNRDTRSATIKKRLDPFPCFKFCLKRQILESYKIPISLLSVTFAVD